jgi:hypothetical protein
MAALSRAGFGSVFICAKQRQKYSLLNMSQVQQKVPVNGGDAKWLELVVQNVKSLRYGVVEIVVHDSRVIQIEKTERVRLDKTEYRPD